MAILLPTVAVAQTSRNPCYINTNGGCTPVSTANPLPVTAGGGGGGAATIANGADVAEGSTTDAPATTPTTASAATTISLLKALANGGSIASGATDSGNPVKIGGVFNTTRPTIASGQRGDIQIDANGNLMAKLAIAPTTGLDGFSNGSFGYQQNATTGTSSPLLPGQGNYIFNATTWDRMRGINGASPLGTGTAAVAIAPTAAATGGIVPIVSSSAENNHVLKGTPGNLYSVYATNLTSTAGFLLVLNSATSPADGAVTPLECAPLPANGAASISYNSGPPAVFSTGITAVITSAATCFTKTTGAITAFIKGSIQ